LRALKLNLIRENDMVVNLPDIFYFYAYILALKTMNNQQ